MLTSNPNWHHKNKKPQKANESIIINPKKSYPKIKHFCVGRGDIWPRDGCVSVISEYRLNKQYKMRRKRNTVRQMDSNPYQMIDDFYYVNQCDNYPLRLHTHINNEIWS